MPQTSSALAGPTPLNKRILVEAPIGFTRYSPIQRKLAELTARASEPRVKLFFTLNLPTRHVPRLYRWSKWHDWASDS